MFSCNLPPALLAKWPGSLTCYCSNTGVEWTQKSESAQKVDLGEENLPTVPAGTQTRDPLIMSPSLYPCSPDVGVRPSIYSLDGWSAAIVHHSLCQKAWKGCCCNEKKGSTHHGMTVWSKGWNHQTQTQNQQQKNKLGCVCVHR